MPSPDDADHGTADPQQPEEMEVVFENRSARISLSGTAVLPLQGRRCPAAVLVHGQGPMDRDQHFGGLRPFKEISSHLASRGIATLRYDKRGVGSSGGDFGSATVEDFASDAEAAVEWLASAELVDPRRIGLIGMSEGGVVVAMVGARSSHLAYCVMLAAPVLPGVENLALQLAALARGSLARDHRFARLRDAFRKLLALVSEGNLQEAEQQEAHGIASELAPYVFNEDTRVTMGLTEPVTAKGLLSLLSSRCLQGCLRSEPEPFFRSITCPCLALYASKDVHVAARENSRFLSSILRESDCTSFEIREVADANHLFQRCSTGFPREYLNIDHSISPEVLHITSTWILDTTSPGQTPSGVAV